MKTTVLFVLIIIFTALNACEKDESGPDLASSITGTYTGTVNVSGTGSAGCTCVLSRSSNTKVNLSITVYSTTVDLDGISVTSAGTDMYDLSLSDSSGSFEGTVDGNTLSWTLTGGGYTETFTGTRQ